MSVDQDATHLVEVRESGSKGLGVFARSNIPQGTRVISESALLEVSSGDSNAKDIVLAFDQLPLRVDLKHHAARESMDYWKSLWRYLTFKEFKEIPLVRSSLYESDEAVVQDMRDSFGPQFLRLAEPIWEIQAEALRNAPFLRHASHTNVK